MKFIAKIITVLLVSITFISPIPTPAKPIMAGDIPPKPVINTEAAICIDADSGQIYFEKNADKRMYPASTTKMMTGILALEMGDLNAETIVSENAGYTDEGQNIGLSPGDRIKLGSLVMGALLHSANDSTVAIGEQVGGTEKAFIHMMNTKAMAIGAYNTKFANTNGYTDPNHYTTAHDLALIARYGIYNNAKFRQLVNTREGAIKWQSKDGREKNYELYNTNRLLHTHEWIDGVKTGTTPSAGNCLVSYGRKEGRNIITVVLNSGNRYGDTMAMFDYAFKAFNKVLVISKGVQLGSASVAKGVVSQVTLKSAGSFAITIPVKDLTLLKRELIIDKNLTAPIKAGQTVGVIKVCYKNKQIFKTDVLAMQDVKKKNILKRMIERVS